MKGSFNKECMSLEATKPVLIWSLLLNQKEQVIEMEYWNTFRIFPMVWFETTKLICSYFLYFEIHFD